MNTSKILRLLTSVLLLGTLAGCDTDTDNDVDSETGGGDMETADQQGGESSEQTGDTADEEEMGGEEAQAGGGGGEREGPDGCYVPAEMRCDCALVQADCTEDVGVWTEGCTSCADLEADAGAGEESDGGGGSPGCYSGPPEHTCDCSVTEEACAGTWTTCDPCS